MILFFFIILFVLSTFFIRINDFMW